MCGRCGEFAADRLQSAPCKLSMIYLAEHKMPRFSLSVQVEPSVADPPILPSERKITTAVKTMSCTHLRASLPFIVNTRVPAAATHHLPHCTTYSTLISFATCSRIESTSVFTVDRLADHIANVRVYSYGSLDAAQITHSHGNYSVVYISLSADLGFAFYYSGGSNSSPMTVSSAYTFPGYNE